MSELINVPGQGTGWTIIPESIKGLRCSFRGGPYMASDGTFGNKNGNTDLTLTDDATNYVQRSLSGVVSANASAFTGGSVPLAVIVTANGRIVSVEDVRNISDGANVAGSAVSFADITGQIANAQVPASAVTQHQGSLAISGSQVTGLQETVEDYVGALIQDSATLDATYTDTAGALSITVKTAAITSAMLRDSAAASVIGRSAATTGAPGDIASTADNDLLVRRSGVLGFGALVAGDVPTITASKISDFTEVAQDAIGAALTDSASIDFTYDDTANTITAIVIDGSITMAKLASMAAASVIGRSAATTGVPAAISSTADNDLLVRRSGVLGFGALTAADLTLAALVGTLKSVTVLSTAGTSTYTVAASVATLDIICIGGGGGGAGVATASANAITMASGGGAGGYCRKLLSVTAGQTLVAVVGAQGSGGPGSASLATAGQASTISTCSAGGGGAGTSGASGTSVVAQAPGAGGTATGGDVNVPGEQGDYGYRLSGTQAIPAGGGNGPLGSGGGRLGGSAAAGNSATGYGGGGGGAFGINTSALAVGGSGSAGVIIIYEYR